MRRLLYGLLGTLLGCWLSTLAYAAPPVRDNTYIAGTEIEPDDVMGNEDPILEYLQDGVDTYAPASITAPALATGAVTSAKILDGTITTADLAFTLTSGNILPSGAVFFMLSGSCPAWTTDVSATYSNLFLRVNATAGTLAGSDTHTHTAGSYASAAHQHETTLGGAATGLRRKAAAFGSGSAFTATAGTASGDSGSYNYDLTSSEGDAAITGTSASGSNIPASLSAKLCQVL